MRILVIGATGYVGSAIAEAFVGAGHAVTGTARSEKSTQKLRDDGVTPVTGDITAPQTVTRAAASSDGVVYAVQYNGANGASVEGAVLRTLVDALSGSGKPLIYTSGIWIYGNTGRRRADEDSPLDPTPLVAHRPQLEKVVLDGVARNVRSIVIRPGDVYGAGGGLPAMWVKSARETGAARFVGDGNNHWPVVHRDDLARLYTLAFENAAAGAIYNAADDTAFTVREMAEAASVGAGRHGAVTSWPLEDARKELGAFADALALDSTVSSLRASEQLSWQQGTLTIVEDLRAGSYACAGDAAP